MLEEWQHQAIIQSMAVQAEIEGMKAENKQREYLGQSMAYSEDCFNLKAQELNELAREITRY